MVVLAGDELAFGPSPISVPHLDSTTFWAAFTVLVVPQVPLSFANSCLATADAARVYFGKAADRVRPGRLATTFGSANLLAGAMSGMPVCHGAGGMTAHYAFGARTAAAPAAMGVLLLTLALGLGAGLAGLLTAFPLPILAGVLACAGVLHIALLRDLAERATGPLRSSSGWSASRSTSRRPRSRPRPLVAAGRLQQAAAPPDCLARDRSPASARRAGEWHDRGAADG